MPFNKGCGDGMAWLSARSGSFHPSPENTVQGIENGGKK
jgi:hypothetical protein